MAPTFNFNDLLTEEDFKSERDATLRVKMTQISGLINVDVSIIRSCLSISVQFLKMSCEEDPARYVQTIHDLRQADRTENIPYSRKWFFVL